jgi:hypothetical protein
VAGHVAAPHAGAVDVLLETDVSIADVVDESVFDDELGNVVAAAGEVGTCRSDGACAGGTISDGADRNN